MGKIVNKRDQGLIIAFTGDGKGKTTAAFGMALRAAGHSKKVAVVQFLKSGSGECRAIRRLGKSVEVWSFGQGFTWQHSMAENKKIVRKAWKKCLKVLHDVRYQVVIFDEINYCMAYKLLDPRVVLRELKKRPPKTHIILTGNGLPGKIKAIADLVTEMRCVKHPFRKGLTAQPGVEF